MSELREPVKENLCRSVPFELTRDGDGGDGLSVAGYAAVFNSPTRIDSWEGCFDEELAPGAFKRTLQGRTPKMQFDHGKHPMLGSLPLGRWEKAREDAKGLYLEGRLSDNWLTQPFRDAIRDGAVEGMSFRFSVVQETWFDRDGNKVTSPHDLMDMLEQGDRHSAGPLRRVLREVKCTEAGPVTWPAYEETSVGVRSGVVMIDLGKLDDPTMRRRLADAVFAADRMAGPNDGELEEYDEAALTPAKRDTIAQMITSGFNPTTATQAVMTGNYQLLLPTSITTTNTNGLINISTTTSTDDSRTADEQAGEHSEDSDPPPAASGAGKHSSTPTDFRSRLRARISSAGKIIDSINSEVMR